MCIGRYVSVIRKRAFPRYIPVLYIIREITANQSDVHHLLPVLCKEVLFITRLAMTNLLLIIKSNANLPRSFISELPHIV